MAWVLPDPDALSRSVPIENSADDAAHLLAVLSALGAPSSLHSTHIAPQATRHMLIPADGVRMKAYRGISDDLMQILGVSAIRLITPIPGSHVVGVEIPRAERAIVKLGDLYVS